MNAQILQKTQGEKYGNYDSDEDVPPGLQAEEVEYKVEKQVGVHHRKLQWSQCRLRLRIHTLTVKKRCRHDIDRRLHGNEVPNEARLLQRGAPVGEPVGMSVSGTGAVSVSDACALPIGDRVQSRSFLTITFRKKNRKRNLRTNLKIQVSTPAAHRVYHHHPKMNTNYLMLIRNW